LKQTDLTCPICCSSKTHVLDCRRSRTDPLNLWI